MIYGSVCSGIEAATHAWHPLGWSPAFFSEIEKFPSAVLAHHYGSNMPGEEPSLNGVPNLGDMTKFEEWPDYAIDLLVGGTPCQSFSVAGLRKGLDDPRGNLMLTFGAIAQRYRPAWVVWENVPGVLSDDGGRGFASLLGLLSGRRIEVPHDGWRNAGVVPGYQGAYGLAWRVLDAQYIRVDGFGRAVPQRRRRVFVVGYLGDWRRAAAVLLEREGMRGDSPPRREAWKDVAPTISSRPTGGGGLGTDFDLDGGLISNDVAPTLNAAFGQKLGLENQHIDGGAGMFVAHTLLAKENDSHAADLDTYVAHSLRGEGFDASEDGTGRGTPIVPVTAKTLTRGAESAGRGGYAGRRQEDDDNLVAYALSSGMHASASRMPHEQGALLPINMQIATRHEALGRGTGFGIGDHGDPAYTITKEHHHAIAIQERAVSENIEAGPQGAGFSEDGCAYTLEARHHVQSVQAGWAVRRLTPTECHRLQGFRDGFCNIPWRGKPESPDGPQYKALGNSMAVNVMRWIGRRIQMVEEITKGLAA
jgi:DNA (cytosine-5)-methyltransferase 1